MTATQDSLMAWLWESLEALGGAAARADGAQAVTSTQGGALREAGLEGASFDTALDRAAETLEAQNKLRRNGDVWVLTPSDGLR